MIATSGTRVTSPVALMSSRVPLIVCTPATGTCANADVDAAVAHSAAAMKACFI
jgi:hypothetical protein